MLKGLLNLITITLILLAINYFELQSQSKKFEPQNLGSGVNSSCDELLPIISADGKTLYFCRDNCKENFGGQDIWVSRLKPNGIWSNATNVGSPLNNEHNNFVISVTPDGNTLLLGNVYHKDGTVGPGISISKKIQGGWSFPERVIIKDYYNISSSGSFFLANDGRTLLMTAQRDDSYGKKDIYVSFLNDDDTWSSPMNLGAAINSAEEEISPFLASDGVTLYFSSEGRGGFGSADVFISRRLDDSWQNWTPPENLGPTINTTEWDAYYKVTAEGDWAYFVSDKNTFGGSDIFRVLLPEHLRPKPVVLMKGRVISYKSRVPLSAKIVYNIIPESKPVGKSATDPDNGYYEITLPSGAHYEYFAESEGYISANWNLDLKLLTKYKEIEQNLELIPTADSIFCIRNVFFERAKSVLNKQAIADIQVGIDFLKENPDCVVEISGHTDITGSAQINEALAEKRAKVVADYFVSQGIPEDRIILKAFSFTKPVISNDTDEGRALNRRVEFLVFRRP
ncbi:MAG: OmpA family protein [Candidatus Kapabacteria bacterium]|nr:OmpA family protein [Candidatus Kapabacteria bacterium]